MSLTVFATEKSNLHITLKCSSTAERKTAGTRACQTHYFYRCFYFSSSLKCTSESGPSGHRLINKLPRVPFCALLCLLVFQCYKVTVVQGLPGGGCRHASLLHFRPKLLTGRQKKERQIALHLLCSCTSDLRGKLLNKCFHFNSTPGGLNQRAFNDLMFLITSLKY